MQLGYINQVDAATRQLQLVPVFNDQRFSHSWVIGKTGVGKSTALVRWAIDDIAAGDGVAFFDPHGDTAEELLRRMPRHRLEDVVYFNPAEVASYRLIGYENRIMAAKDFDNDKKDAGEIGAGHTVTALYEIVPGSAESGGNLGRELKYQRKTGRELTKAAASGELFTLYLRYKDPDSEESTKLKFVQKDSDKRFGQASDDFRFASAVAAFGMLLRGSQYAGDLNWSAAEEFAAGSLGEDPGGYRNEFLELIHRAGELRSR